MEEQDSNTGVAEPETYSEASQYGEAQLERLFNNPLVQFNRKRPEDQRVQPPKPDEKPPEPTKSFVAQVQNKPTRRYVGPKREHKVTMEVFLEPNIREDIKALAVTQGLAAQEYVEKLINNVVSENHELVEQGRDALKRAHGNTTRAKLELLKQRARLPEAFDQRHLR